MIKNLLPALPLLTVLSVVLPVSAQTANDCGFSFAILPDGSCVDLSYVSILGSSRGTLAQANAISQRQYNSNLAREIYYMQNPWLDRETKEERDERYEALASESIARDEVEETVQTIEDILYPLHVEAMNIMGGAFR